MSDKRLLFCPFYDEWNVVLLPMAQILFPYRHSFLILSTKHTKHSISCRLGSCCCQCHKMQARWKETTQVSQLTEFFTKLFSPIIAKIMSNLIYSLTYHFLIHWASSTTKATIRSIIDGLHQISFHSVKKCFWICE